MQENHNQVEAAESLYEDDTEIPIYLDQPHQRQQGQVLAFGERDKGGTIGKK